MLERSTTPPGRVAERRAWVTVAVATLCSALPAFLTGALGVQLRDELGLTATQIGLSMGASFTVAAVASAPMGRLAQRIGPRLGFRTGLAVSATSMSLVALLAREFWQFVLFLAIAGAGNALNQPSANLLLATHIDRERMGWALATKQSGMPAAALVGGGTVPLIALTVGWEWAYALGAVLAVVAAVALPADRRGIAARTSRTKASAPAHLVDGGAVLDPPDRSPARPDLGLALLVLYACVGLLGATAAGAMVGFITSGAEASGLGPGVSGLVLSLGSLVGIISRLVQGLQVDRRGVLPIQRLVWLFGLGGLGVLFLAVDRPLTYLLAPIPAFAFGWAWPGLFNLSVIRNNPSAPAAATGVSQVGVFAGAAVGPALGGLIIDAAGYRALWLVSSASLLAGSAIAVYLRARIRAGRARSGSIGS
ncbi:MAG: MFS transporter [Actinomycetota bacterium]